MGHPVRFAKSLEATGRSAPKLGEHGGEVRKAMKLRHSNGP